jgi:hypothetical protein
MSFIRRRQATPTIDSQDDARWLFFSAGKRPDPSAGPVRETAILQGTLLDSAPLHQALVALLFLQSLHSCRLTSCIQLMVHGPGTIHRAAYASVMQRKRDRLCQKIQCRFYLLRIASFSSSSSFGMDERAFDTAPKWLGLVQG